MSANSSGVWRSVAVAFLLGWTASSRAVIVTGPVENPATGHLYYLLGQNTWTASESEAQAMGGHLVTLNDAAEDAWVYQQFAGYGGVVHNLWIGLTDAGAEGAWRWTNGEAAAYTHWVPGDPNNLGGVENYGVMWGAYVGFSYDGFWNDLPDGGDTYAPFGVVEISPAPWLDFAATGSVASVLSLQVHGHTGRTNVVETSTNFVAWTPLYTNVITTSPYQVDLPRDSAHRARYYRAVRLP